MPLPHSKQELADWILRRLGAPVVNIEITDVQLEDVIDEAVQYFQEYHYDGAERAYRVIKVKGDVLAGNNRRHQELNAPMYDVEYDSNYRVGDRVMTYKADRTPDLVWIKHDSDEVVWYENYTASGTGSYFVPSSNASPVDLSFLSDSEARNYVDSDGVFVLYDSETHNIFIYYTYTEEQYYYQKQPAGFIPTSASFVDSDGAFVSYDSDKHVVFQYDSDAAGLFVDSEGTYVAFDSDNLNHYTYVYTVATDSDTSTTKWVDSDGDFVTFDSDKHSTFNFVQDPTGLYVREEGTDRYVLATTDPVYLIPGTIYFRRDLTKAQLYDRTYSNIQRYSRQYTYPTDIYMVINEQRFVDSDGAYVMFDSEKHFVLDSDAAGLFVKDSEGVLIDYVAADHGYIEIKDSDGNLVMIDSEFYEYDSDKHNSYNFSVDSDGIYAQENGVYALYDSEIHNTVNYDSDSAGNYVDSDGTFVTYDSDKHVTLPRRSRSTVLGNRYVRWTSMAQRYIVNNANVEYTSDPLGEWLISTDGQSYTLYDSDLYTTINYVRDSEGPYVDSDGQFVRYNSNLYLKKSFDSEAIRVDSDGTVRVRIDSEGMLTDLYIGTESAPGVYTYTPYDSDTHAQMFYDSDGAGIRLNFGINLDMLFSRTFDFFPAVRYSKGLIVDSDITARRYKRSFSPYQRYTKNYNSVVFYYRRSELDGIRYDRTLEKKVRVIGEGWNDYWVKEDIALTDPKIDFDYSKVGQVGIPVPDTIIGINKVFRIDNFAGQGMWNYEYQYFLNNFDMFYGNGGSGGGAMTNYYITKSYLDMIDNMMNVQPSIRFNKVRNRMYIDTNWARLERQAKNKDYYLLVECYEVNDPTVYGDVYKDKWLKRYATSLAKLQWGSNLKKYSNTELPGGLMVDGQALYDEAKQESTDLEDELKKSQIELDFIIG